MRNKYLYGLFWLRDGEAVELQSYDTPDEANRELVNYKKYGWSGVKSDDVLLVLRYDKE